MNEELLRLAYSKMKTDASFETFVQDFKSSVDLQNLAYSKMKTDASFETFVQDALGSVKKKEPTAQEQMSEAMAPKQDGLDFVSEDSSLDLSTQQGRDEAYKESQDFEVSQEEKIKDELSVYTYAGRPDAKYKKQPDGSYLINLGDKTQNKYIPLDDPDGTRTAELNRAATPAYQAPVSVYGEYKKIPTTIEQQEALTKAEATKELTRLVNSFKSDQYIKPDYVVGEELTLMEKLKAVKPMVDVTDEATIKRLDKLIKGYDTESKEYKDIQRRKKSVSKIKSDIDESFKQNQYESEFVPKFREQLKSLGGPESEIFQVEEAEAGFDYVKVKNKLTGETKTFDLSTAYGAGNKTEAKLLKSFIELSIKGYDRDLARKKYEDLAARQFASPEFMSDVQAFEKRAGMGTTLSAFDDILGYVFGETEDEKTEDKLKELINTIPLDYNFPNASPEERDALIEARKEWLGNSEEFDEIVMSDNNLLPAYYEKENRLRKSKEVEERRKLKQSLEEKKTLLSKDKRETEVSIALGRQPQALQFETILGPMSNEQKLNYIDNQLSNTNQKLANNKYQLENIESNLYRAQGASYLLEEDRGSLGTGVAKKFVGGSASVIGFLRGDTEKDIYGQTYAERAMEELIPGVTTQEYFSSENRNIFTKAVYGITESVGAMATGSVLTAGVPIATIPMGRLGKFVIDGGLLGLFAQSFSQNKALMDNPEFDDVPEYEKIIMSTIYGLGVGALEKVGLGKAMLAKPAGQKLVSKVLNKSFKDIPEGASAKVIADIVQRNAKETVAERGLNVLTASGFEASTEMAQAGLMDIGLKKVYNGIKGKEYFKTPQTIGKAALEILENGVVGAVGGGMMQVGAQATRATIKGFNKNSGLNETDFDMMRSLATRKRNYELYKTQLDTQVALGKMTQDQAQKSLDGLEYSLGVFNQIPENLNTSDAKEAFNLIVEKRNLESKVEGKEPNLVVKEKERIKEIDNELTELGKKEVVAEEVAEPTVAEEVVAEEVVAEEVVAEEVAEPTVSEEVVAEEVVAEEVVAEEITEQEASDFKEFINQELKEDQPQFQLDSKEVPTARKRKLEKRAKQLMDEVQPELSEKSFVVEEIKSKPIPVVITENKQLTDKVKKIKVSELKDKRINLVMADQLKVDDKRMGGALFPLQEGVYGKNIAWASIDERAAREIVKGAVNSDFSVVYNMSPSALDSNVVMLDSLIDKVKESPKSSLIFEAMMNDIQTKTYGKKTDTVHNIASESKSINDFAEGFAKLDVDTKAKIFKDVLPSEKVEATTEVGILFSNEGVTKESLRAENVEQFASDLPMGAMTMVLKITDKKGNPVTKDTIEEAIVTQDQQESEGIKKHRNYPVYIRGEAVAMLEDTVPFWSVNKTALSTINAKIDGVIKKKVAAKVEKKTGKVLKPATTRKTTASEARGAEMRRASMKAGTAFKVQDAAKTNYEIFITKLSKSFPSVEVVTDQKTFDDLVSNLNAKKLSNKNAKVYGAVYEGKLYLNPALENYNTPIHEFGHLWMNTARELAPETYQKGISLVEGTDYVSEVEANPAYKKVIKKMKEDGATDEYINTYVLEEALATAIGDKGESFATAAQEKNFKAWLNQLFDFVKKLTGISKLSSTEIQDLSLDEFTDAVVVDLLSENNLVKDPETVILSDALQLMTEESFPSISSIISEGRRNNFKDETIKDYLIRERGMSATEAKKALEVPVADIFENKTVPDSFKNIMGGLNSGGPLFNRVIEYGKKLERKNLKSKKYTKQEIVDKTIEFLQQQPEYIAESDTYKVKGELRSRKGLSTTQAALLSDIQKFVGTKPTKNMDQKIKEARTIVRERKKGAKELNKVKAGLRNFIRKTLPPSLYTKKEVIDMVRSVTEATEKNIENVYEDVAKLVIRKNVESLSKNINNILGKKYTEVQSGRLKGKIISVAAKERIDYINSKVFKPTKKTITEQDVETIAKINEDLVNEFNTLNSEGQLSNEQVNRMVDIQVAIEYNNSQLMDDTDFSKIQSLDNIDTTLSQIISEGKTELKSEIERSRLKAKEDFEIAYEEITGNKIDLGSPDAIKELKLAKRRQENKELSKKVDAKTKQILKSIGVKIDNVFTSAEALDGLIDKISSMPGEMFGGNIQELVTERIDESSIEFKKAKMEFESMIKNKLIELYGNKSWFATSYKLRQNKKSKNTGIVIDKSLLQKAKDNYNDNPNGKTKKALKDAVVENSLVLSQNQLYYLYNQYKDPSNHPSFENMNMFGLEQINSKVDSKEEIERKKEINKENAKRVMSEIENALEPEVKKWADFQVDELFPSKYSKYNDVYRKIYRTNMPQNENYAGKIYRDGVEQEPLDLISGVGKVSNVVTAQSSKARMNSNKKIIAMDGNDALLTYLTDMEYFAAYAENISYINRIFSNQYISSSIENIYGKTTKELIDVSLKKIANRGARTSTTDKFVNSFNTAFILARLALSPVIYIKQLTSTFTYMNDIGGLKWLEYASKNKAQQAKVWKEVRDNSIYMQDRKYDSIMKNIESYSEDAMRSFVPKPAKEWILKAMMYHIKVGDRTAIMLGGLPVYSYHKAQFKKKNPKATEQQAIDYAVKRFERATKRTQQSSDLQDKDVFQTGDAIARGLNMFLTTPKQYLRKEIQSIRNLSKKISKLDKTAGKGTLMENVRTFIMYHIAMPVLFQYISSGLPGLLTDFDDEDEADLFRAGIVGNLNALFILGEFINMGADLATDKPWAGTGTKSVGLLQTAQQITTKAKIAIQTKDPVKKAEKMKDFYLELFTMGGVPGPTLNKLYENYSTLGEGGDISKDILKILGYSNYVIEGGAKTSSSDPVREFRKELLEGTGYTSETKLKEEDPAAWRKTFGKAKNIIKMEKLKRKAAREERKNK